MRVRCVKAFRDFDAGRLRNSGEEFDVSPDRFEAINSTRYGVLVEALEVPEGGEEGAQKRTQRRKTAKV